MTLLPDGKSERSVLEGEITAAKELRRLTDAYLAKVRALWPNLSEPTKRRVEPAMKALKDTASTQQSVHRR